MGIDPLLAAYLTSTFILAITPGATTAVVVRHAIARGRRGGLTAAAGAAVANSTQAAVAGFGAAVLLARSPMAMTSVRVAGGLYLLWLGVKSVRRNDARQNFRDTTDENSAGHDFAPFRDGLAVNLLNPAITTFYVAVVPSFVPRGAAGWHYAMLAAAHVAIAFGCHALWTAAFDALGPHARRPAVRRTLDVLTGLVLIALAISILA